MTAGVQEKNLNTQTNIDGNDHDKFNQYMRKLKEREEKKKK